MKYSMCLPVIFLFLSYPAWSQSIMECSLQHENSSDKLFVYLTDTAGLAGFNIKIGTVFDSDDLLSEEYLVDDLPVNATLVENTFSVMVDKITTTPSYVWVTLLLSGGGSREIKLTAE